MVHGTQVNNGTTIHKMERIIFIMILIVATIVAITGIQTIALIQVLVIREGVMEEGAGATKYRGSRYA